MEIVGLMTQQAFASPIAEADFLTFSYGNNRIIQNIKHSEQGALRMQPSLLDMLAITVFFFQLHLFIKRRLEAFRFRARIKNEIAVYVPKDCTAQ
jgi:hypothetical protein